MCSPLDWIFLNLGLSDSIRQELTEKRIYHLTKLIDADVSDIILSWEAVAELKKALESAKEKAEREKI